MQLIQIKEFAPHLIIFLLRQLPASAFTAATVLRYYFVTRRTECAHMARCLHIPRSLPAWLLGINVYVAGSYAVYRVSVSPIEYTAQQSVERSQQAIQKIQQQQQLTRQPQVIPQPQPSISSEARARQQVAARLRQAELAEAPKTKEEAWKHVYRPPTLWISPELDKRAAICDEAAGMAHKQLGDAWACERLQSQR